MKREKPTSSFKEDAMSISLTILKSSSLPSFKGLLATVPISIFSLFLLEKTALQLSHKLSAAHPKQIYSKNSSAVKAIRLDSGY